MGVLDVLLEKWTLFFSRFLLFRYLLFGIALFRDILFFYFLFLHFFKGHGTDNPWEDNLLGVSVWFLPCNGNRDGWIWVTSLDR